MLKNWGKELKEFILHGNVLDMAVGIIIGAAFGKIVDSLVKDIIMPPVGLILGKVDFSNLYLQIYPYGTHYPSLDAAKAAGAVTINYGAFLNNVISFIIVACVVFLIIKSINTLRTAACKQEEAEKEVTTKECPYCYSCIPVKAVRCPHCTSELR